MNYAIQRLIDEGQRADLYRDPNESKDPLPREVAYSSRDWHGAIRSYKLRAGVTLTEAIARMNDAHRRQEIEPNAGTAARIAEAV